MTFVQELTEDYKVNYFKSTEHQINTFIICKAENLYPKFCTLGLQAFIKGRFCSRSAFNSYLNRDRREFQIVFDYELTYFHSFRALFEPTFLPQFKICSPLNLQYASIIKNISGKRLHKMHILKVSFFKWFRQ